MQLQCDLIRDLLLTVERYLPESRGELQWPEGLDGDTINYHLMLLAEAGLIKADCSYSIGGKAGIPTKVYVVSLTWGGHDYVDLVRDESVHDDVKERVKKAGLDTSSVSILSQIATDVVKDMVGL